MAMSPVIRFNESRRTIPHLKLWTRAIKVGIRSLLLPKQNVCSLHRARHWSGMVENSLEPCLRVRKARARWLGSQYDFLTPYAPNKRNSWAKRP